MKLGRSSHGTVVAYPALFVALGGGAMAASHLGKNSVGSKQLKKNAVTTAKIKKEAVTAAKVKKGTLTGTQINASTLGTVPTAQQANTVAAPEGWHEVGAPGEPGFENSWKNSPSPPGKFAHVSFYKDQGGVVHLKGLAVGGTSGTTIFRLPPGFQPESGQVLAPLALCGGCAGGAGPVLIAGPGVSPGSDGLVLSSLTATAVGLDGVTFRAGS